MSRAFLCKLRIDEKLSSNDLDPDTLVSALNQAYLTFEEPSSLHQIQHVASHEVSLVEKQKRLR